MRMREEGRRLRTTAQLFGTVAMRGQATRLLAWFTLGSRYGDNGASIGGLRGRLPSMGFMIRAGDGERREDAYFLVLSVA